MQRAGRPGIIVAGGLPQNSGTGLNAVGGDSQADASIGNGSGGGGDRGRIDRAAGDLKALYGFLFALRLDQGASAEAPDGEIEDGTLRCGDGAGAAGLAHGVTVDHV